MPGPNPVHTAGNAVPPVDGTDLGHLLEDLAGFHPGIDLIRDGIRHLATDRLTRKKTQTLVSVLAGSNGADVLTLIGATVARLTNPDTNPSLRTLDFEQQKETQRHGELLVHHLADDPDLHQHASEAAAAIDQEGHRS